MEQKKKTIGSLRRLIQAINRVYGMAESPRLPVKEWNVREVLEALIKQLEIPVVYDEIKTARFQQEIKKTKKNVI